MFSVGQTVVAQTGPQMTYIKEYAEKHGGISSLVPHGQFKYDSQKLDRAQGVIQQAAELCKVSPQKCSTSITGNATVTEQVKKIHCGKYAIARFWVDDPKKERTPNQLAVACRKQIGAIFMAHDKIAAKKAAAQPAAPAAPVTPAPASVSKFSPPPKGWSVVAGGGIDLASSFGLDVQSSGGFNGGTDGLCRDFPEACGQTGKIEDTATGKLITFSLELGMRHTWGTTASVNFGPIFDFILTDLNQETAAGTQFRPANIYRFGGKAGASIVLSDNISHGMNLTLGAGLMIVRTWTDGGDTAAVVTETGAVDLDYVDVAPYAELTSSLGKKAELFLRLDVRPLSESTEVPMMDTLDNFPVRFRSASVGLTLGARAVWSVK